jgi:hypothetical protein
MQARVWSLDGGFEGFAYCEFGLDINIQTQYKYTVYILRAVIIL